MYMIIGLQVRFAKLIHFSNLHSAQQLERDLNFENLKNPEFRKQNPIDNWSVFSVGFANGLRLSEYFPIR